VQRPRAELLITAVVEKRLGALSACAHFLRRLDVAGIIDELCAMSPTSPTGRSSRR
jgi:hypothetical protein